MSITIARAVSRFLSFRLPLNFYPDCYISFDREKAEKGTWPTGTNLLDAGQAEAMIKHLLAVTPGELTDLGGAIHALKSGKSVARMGWNGKNQFVYMVRAADLQNGLKNGYGEYVGEPVFTNVLAMKTTANQIQVGWLASQTDMLAEDWVVLE